MTPLALLAFYALWKYLQKNPVSSRDYFLLVIFLCAHSIGALSGSGIIANARIKLQCRRIAARWSTRHLRHSILHDGLDVVEVVMRK